ncbi:unnamed protein product [Macrosiphum euphorbiae]|uniref:Uncharacterized protein n=1 Tax=Macrosiphum euphorbiae TaxID=13131 RepID=A0AAV0XP43_9HEMI|nr:unnamed protein product [Macrosiphum euphorbiae]
MSSKNLKISVPGGRIDQSKSKRPAIGCSKIEMKRKKTQDPQLGVNDPNWVGRMVKKFISMRNCNMPNTIILLSLTPQTLEGDNGETQDRGTTTCRVRQNSAI